MASRHSLRSLDALNFFLADVAGGVGPFLVIWLAVSLQWGPARIGLLMGLTGLVPLLVQVPAGALVDSAPAKRMLIVVATTIIGAACLILVQWPRFGVIATAQSLIGIAGAVCAPAVAAISLGLVGRDRLPRRIGRNGSIGAAGNVFLALAAGALGHWYGYSAMFYFVAAMALVTAACALLIREREIDHRLARGADKDEHGASAIAGLGVVLGDRRLLIFAACAVGFHFANAALLTLVGQLFSSDVPHQAALYLSASVVVTQAITIPIAAGAGVIAQKLPRKPVYLIAFIALPLRCLLYLFAQGPDALVALQVLDGIGAGVFGVMQVLVVADITRGTGRFNLAQGAIGTAVGLGAALSNLVAGEIAGSLGYNGAFAGLGAVALVALVLFATAMPETRPQPQNTMSASTA